MIVLAPAALALGGCPRRAGHGTPTVVRERRGSGRDVLLRHGTLYGVTSLGFYGHRDWWAGAAWAW